MPNNRKGRLKKYSDLQLAATDPDSENFYCDNLYNTYYPVETQPSRIMLLRVTLFATPINAPQVMNNSVHLLFFVIFIIL